jgi:hypothetical protein
VGAGTGGGWERRRVGTEETPEVGGSTTMAATTLSSSSEGASGPLAPDVGSRATRSTELGHGGAQGGRRQRWRRARGYGGKLMSGGSVEFSGEGGAQACGGEPRERRWCRAQGQGAELEVAGMIWWMTVMLSWTSI